MLYNAKASGKPKFLGSGGSMVARSVTSDTRASDKIDAGYCIAPTSA